MATISKPKCTINGTLGVLVLMDSCCIFLKIYAQNELIPVRDFFKNYFVTLIFAKLKLKIAILKVKSPSTLYDFDKTLLLS